MLRKTQTTATDHQTHGFSARLHHAGGLAVRRLTGTVGLEHGKAFESVLLGLAQRIDADTVLDLSALRFINVIGLGVVVRFGRTVQARGYRLMLHGADPLVGRLIRTVRLHELFPPVERDATTRTAALEHALAPCA